MTCSTTSLKVKAESKQGNRKMRRAKIRLLTPYRTMCFIDKNGLVEF